MQGRIVIIGAGPAGMGAAWRLHELGYSDWLLLEQANEAGGLSASVRDAQGFTWDIGGHVLFSHYPYFDQLMDRALGDQWVWHERESWIWIYDRFVPYPLQYNIRHLPPEPQWDCVQGLLRAQKARASDPASPPAVSNFRDWLLANFGEGLPKHFLLPYNWKVWGWPPELMDFRWTGDRVATVDLERLLRNIILGLDDAGWGPNQKFRFPLAGGTGAIWRSLAAQLPRERMRFGTRVVAVNPGKKFVRLENGEEIAYDALVSTMPLDVLVAVAGLDHLREHARLLEKQGVYLYGIGLAGRPPAHLATKCWMYFPEPVNPAFRVTVFSNYSPHNVPDPARTWSLMAEVSHSPHKPVDPKTLAQEAIDGLVATRLLPRNPEIVSLWEYHAPVAYPVPTLGRDEALAQILPELESMDIFSRGRFGAWKYEVGNQDHSTMQGVELADRLIEGKPELTVVDPTAVNAPKK
jgi:protoporphyrinogen oxidase